LEQWLEQIAVLRDAADRGATEAGTVIATLEADEPGARALPGKLVIASAILSAVSTASEPELQKNTWPRSPGASAASFEARRNAAGWPS